MAILARASALLALLPAVAGEAPLEQTSGECMASSMRVELLQKPAIALTQVQRTRPVNTFNQLIKSTFAISSSHTGKNLAFKRFFFPVITEEEYAGDERPDFLQLVQDAIGQGAALPDNREIPASSFDYVAGHEACGKTADLIVKPNDKIQAVKAAVGKMMWAPDTSKVSPEAAYTPKIQAVDDMKASTIIGA